MVQYAHTHTSGISKINFLEILVFGMHLCSFFSSDSLKTKTSMDSPILDVY